MSELPIKILTVDNSCQEQDSNNNSLNNQTAISTSEIIKIDQKLVNKITKQQLVSSPAPKQVMPPENQVNSQSLQTVNSNFKQTLLSAYTFENFFQDSSNELAYGVAKRMLCENETSSNNFLYIYGSVGLGKTHLLHAAGNAYQQKFPDKRVYYTSSENFTNKYLAALNKGKIDQFKKLVRNIDLFLIDDIQFMSGKKRTEEEFFHTFNSLFQKNKKIIISADSPPKNIVGLDPRLQNRFSSGVIADLSRPCADTRAKIISYKANQAGVYIEEEAVELIANKVTSNIRELEGSLNRLIALSSLRKEKISYRMAEQSISSLEVDLSNLSPAEIKYAVAQYFSLKPKDLESKRRTRKISYARQIATYLIRKHTEVPYVEIGNCFGGRDHSSVIYAIKSIEEKMSKDKSIYQTIEELEKRLN